MLGAGDPVVPGGGELPSGMGELGDETESRPRRRPREDDSPDGALLERAEQAEARVAELETALEACERARALEGGLRDAGAIDLETAITMALGIMERSERESDGEPLSVADVVGELKRTKPFLFASALPGNYGAMSGVSGLSVNDLDRLAEQARQSGDRRLLMRYLLQRREG